MLKFISDDYSLDEICADRRVKRHRVEASKFQFRSNGRTYSNVPVVECTTGGARIVLGNDVRRGQRLEVELVGSTFTLGGVARVAWTQPLLNGRQVAGIEFLSVRRRNP